MKEKFTKGPWRWEVNKKHKQVTLCGGKPKYDLDVLRFERYGMQGAQPTFDIDGFQGNKASDLSCVVEGREHHEDWFRGLEHPDAHLIASAPEMYAALKTIAVVLSGNSEFSEDEINLERVENILAKARGEM